MWDFFKRRPNHQSGDDLVHERIPADLEILVSLAGGELSYEVRARDAKLGLNFRPFDRVLLREQPIPFMDELGRQIFLLRQMTDRDEAAAKLKGLGSTLAETFLPAALCRLLFDLRDRIASLQIQSEASFLPWELFWLGDLERGFFVGEIFDIAHWLKGTPQSLFLPGRSIAVIADTEFAAAPGAAELAMLHAYAGSEHELCNLESTKTAVRQELGRGHHDHYHFCGHGEYRRMNFFQAFLGLGNKRALVPEDLGGLSLPGSPFLFFNACFSGRIGEGLKAFAGWPPELIRRGAGAFLGAVWAVPNADATRFAEHFYSAFFDRGLPIAKAVRLARLALRDREPGNPVGLGYRLFAHPCALSSPPMISGKPVEVLGEVRNHFALWRVTECAEAESSWVRVEPRLESGEARVELGTTETSERWSVNLGNPGLAAQLVKLRELGREAGGSLFGIFQIAPFDRETERAANFLDQLRLARSLPPESREQAILETRQSPEARRLLEELGELAELHRFRMISQTAEGLRFALLERIRDRFSSPIGLGEIEPETAFAMAAGRSLSYLQLAGSEKVKTSRLLELIGNGIQGFCPVKDPRAELSAYLLSQQRLLTNSLEHQKVDLGDLFVHSRGRVCLPVGLMGESSTGPAASDAVSWLLDELLRERKKFLLVLGDFGHGKTTLLKFAASHLARQTAEDQPIPVYIRLRDFRPTSPLREIVREILAEFLTLSDQLWREGRWILLCDGFDEFNIQQGGHEDVVALRFSSLLEASRLSNVQVVVAARPILFLDPTTRSQRVGELDRLILRPFESDQVEEWLEKWSHGHPRITRQDLVDRGLADIVAVPVLLFLVALMFDGELRGQSGPLSRSGVYRRFFDWTEKGGLVDRRGDADKHPVPANFRQVLQEAAWLLFCHPESRAGVLHYQVLLEELRGACAIENPRLDSRIFVAHAFREQKPLYIELLHQSLREYLVAERIFDAIRPAGEGEPAEPVAWQALVSDRPLTQAEFDFLRSQIEEAPPDMQRQLLDRIRHSWHWPATLGSLSRKGWESLRFRQMWAIRNQRPVAGELQDANLAVRVGNLSLIGFLTELWLSNAAGQLSPDVFLVGLPALHSHFQAETYRLRPLLEILRASFRGLSLGLAAMPLLTGASFHSIEWRDCRFEGIRFEDCRFQDCLFKRSVFESVVFYRCDFADCQIFNCELNGVTFERCTTHGLKATSSFGHAVSFAGCDLEQTEIEIGNTHGISYRSCVVDQVDIFEPRSVIEGAGPPAVDDCWVRGSQHRLKKVPARKRES